MLDLIKNYWLFAKICDSTVYLLQPAVLLLKLIKNYLFFIKKYDSAELLLEPVVISSSIFSNQLYSPRLWASSNISPNTELFNNLQKSFWKPFFEFFLALVHILELISNFWYRTQDFLSFKLQKHFPFLSILFSWMKNRWVASLIVQNILCQCRVYSLHHCLNHNSQWNFQ